MQKKRKKSIKEVKRETNLEKRTINSKLIYLDNAATSLKTDEFIEVLCNSYVRFEWFCHRKEILNSLFNELSEFLEVSIENIALVPSSTYAINEIWKYIFEIGNFKKFRVNIQKEDHISNISSTQYWKQLETTSNCKLEYFSFKDINNMQLKNSDVILITVMDNLGINNFLRKNIECLRRKNPKSMIIGDLTQYIPYWDPKENLTYLFDIFYFSTHKCFGPMGLGIIVSKNKKLVKKINCRKQYYLDWRSILAYERSLKQMKALDIKSQRDKEKKLRNFWIENFPKNSQLSFRVGQHSLIFLVNFESEYFHDLLYFLESNNIVFRAYDLCNNNSAIEKKQIRFSLSFLNSLEDLKILFATLKKFFELKLI